MKLIYFVLLTAGLTISSCMKHPLAGTTTVKDQVDSTAVLVYKGSFQNGRYGKVYGTAEVYQQNNTYLLKLQGFSTSNGPALHVMLSKEATPQHFIDLGPIKSTNGDQVYTIPGKPVFSSYKFVSIHCVEYNHLFGFAEIN